MSSELAAKPISFEAFSNPPSGTDEEISRIKQEIKENNYKKEAALQEQRIELLEIQIKETKIREDNLRKMNDNLTSALSELSQDPKKFQNNGLKEIQQTLDKNSKEFIENKLKNNELIKVLEAEIKKLQECLLQEQMKSKDSAFDHEKKLASQEAKIHELEGEKSKLETIIKQIQAEQRKSFDNFTQDHQVKQIRHNELLEKMREKHEKEVMELQSQRQEHFNEIRTIYEQEKASLESRLEKTQSALDKAQAQLKQYCAEYSTQSFEENDNQLSLLQKEKDKLSQTISEINRTYSEEIKGYKKNKEELVNRIREVEAQATRLKEDNARLREEKRRIEAEMEKMRERVKELEKSEKSLKTLLNEYQHNFIIQGQKTEGSSCSNYTPQLRGEEEVETEDLPLEEPEESVYEPEDSGILRENLIYMNRKEKKSTKSFALDDGQNLDFHFNNEKSRKSFTTAEKFMAKILKNPDEPLRKTPVQPRTSSKFQMKTNEKQLKPAHIPKSSHNNENMPIPLSDLGLKSDRLAQLLENTSYKKKRPSSFLARKGSENALPCNNFQTPVYNNPNGNTDAYNEFVFNNNTVNKNPQNSNNPNVATALLCEICRKSYPPLEFLDHLDACKAMQQAEPFRNACCAAGSGRFSSGPSEQKRARSFHHQSAKQLHNFPSTASNDSNLLNVLENLNYEKKLIFDKLREVEDKLRDTEDKNCHLHEEKIGLQRHFEGIVSQLKNAQVQLALSQEEKSENESNLKKEIKFLIGKLLKAKSKLSEEKQMINNSSINMSGFLNFYHQNKDDSTFNDDHKNGNNESESSMLNQSINQIISSSQMTINNHKKGGLVQNKGGLIKRPENMGRSKTPLMMKLGEKIKKLNLNEGEITGESYMDYGNRFKKKK